MTIRSKTGFLTLLLCAGGSYASSPSPSTAVTVDIPTVSCVSGLQLCEPAFSTSVTTTAAWQPIQLTYNVPTSACSSGRLHIFVDGALVKTTEWLGWTGAPPPFDTLPLTTGNLVLQYVRPGTHVVSINIEGQVSGCNSGKVIQWEGTLLLK